MLGIHSSSPLQMVAKSVVPMDPLKGLEIHPGDNLLKRLGAADAVTAALPKQPDYFASIFDRGQFDGVLTGLDPTMTYWKRISAGLMPATQPFDYLAQGFAASAFARDFQWQIGESPALKALSLDLSTQLRAGVGADLLGPATTRALKSFEVSVVEARAAALIPELASDLPLFKEASLQSPLEDPIVATEAAAVIAEDLHIDDATESTLQAFIEELQIFMATERAAREDDRRRADAQFYLALMLTLITYLFPPA